MPASLDGKRILILATNGFGQAELEVPRNKLKAAGATVDVVSPEKGEIKCWDKKDWGRPVKVDKALADAAVADYDAIVLPGGQINPYLLRVNADALKLIKAFYDVGKTVAAVYHPAHWRGAGRRSDRFVEIACGWCCTRQVSMDHRVKPGGDEGVAPRPDFAVRSPSCRLNPRHNRPRPRAAFPGRRSSRSPPARPPNHLRGIPGRCSLARRDVGGVMTKRRAGKGPPRIEIDDQTADLLQARAAALGLSVAELLAALAGGGPAAPRDAMADRTNTAAGPDPAARWRDVKAWIDSWGKADELPRPKLGK